MTVIQYVQCLSLLMYSLTKVLQKRRKKTQELPPALQNKMKKAFLECHKAVMACEDETGRKRCELFKELPDKRVSRYYQLNFTSVHNIALHVIRITQITTS